jgi:hypothetical protein
VIPDMDAQMHSPSSALSTPRSDAVDGGPAPTSASTPASAANAPLHHRSAPSAPSSHGVEVSQTQPPPAHVTTASANSTSTSTTTPATTQDSAPPAKKPRKKKETTAAAATGEEKPKKTRKPREKKEPTTTTTSRRSRQKTTEPKEPKEIRVVEEPAPTPPPPQQQPPPPPSQQQPKITDLVHTMPAAPKEPSNAASTNPSLAYLTASASPQASRPSSSGQRYDPIRAATMESSNPPPPRNTATPVSPPSAKPVISSNRASASPSIKSLIDPPGSNPTYSSASSVPPAQPRFATSTSLSPGTQPKPAPVPQTEVKTALVEKPALANQPAAVDEMDIDKEPLTKPAAIKKADAKKGDGASTAPSSNAPTPSVKPVRQKEQPPPLPTGSGLLAGSAFGPGAMTNGDAADTKGVDICITFDLKNKTNVTINWAQEVEKKYGFAALHPRLAAQRERRRQVAAAGAALERASGVASADDMSLDLSEPESNADTGGGEEDQQLTANGQPRKRRKRKAEEYDKDDDFIDDTELIWENSRLMAQDGFFVYSGPLVPEGEKPVADKYAFSTYMFLITMLTLLAELMALRSVAVAVVEAVRPVPPGAKRRRVALAAAAVGRVAAQPAAVVQPRLASRASPKQNARRWSRRSPRRRRRRKRNRRRRRRRSRSHPPLHRLLPFLTPWKPSVRSSRALFSLVPRSPR